MTPKPIGSGSIVRRDRHKDGTLKPRHRCRVWDLTVTMDDGSHPSRRFEGTEREARAALPEWVESLGAVASAATFSGYALAWHERRKASGAFAWNTMRGERSRVRHIESWFGGTPLSEVDADSVSAMYASLAGSGMAQSSLKVLHVTVMAVLRDAQAHGLFDMRQVASLQPPRPRSRERRAMSTSEMDALASSLDLSNGRHRAVFLCLMCGLRRAEAVALRWRDYDGESVHVLNPADGSYWKSIQWSNVKPVSIASDEAGNVIVGEDYE